MLRSLEKLLFEGVNIMSQYKVEFNHDMNIYPRLSHQQTMEKLEIYHHTHDEEVKEELVMANLKLVLSLVQKYQQKQSIEDLFQVGIIGLIKAIDNFNIELNVHFSTYAVPLIMGEIKRYIRDNSPLRVPRSLRDIAYHALRKHESYLKKHNHEPRVDELAKSLDIDESLLVEALASTHSVSSLSQDIQNDGEGKIELINQVPHPHNEMDHIQRHLDLYDAMNQLDEREKQVIQERFFQDHTQSEIAQSLMISQAQVSRIEKQALHSLKKLMEG